MLLHRSESILPSVLHSSSRDDDSEHCTDRSIFGLLNQDATSSETKPRLVRVALLLLVTWVGINAVWGVTSARDTLVSSWLDGVLPLDVWVWAAGIALTAATFFTAAFRRIGLLAVSSMLAAYFGGVLFSRLAYAEIEPRGGIPIDALSDLLNFTWERSFILYPAIPMLLVYWLMKPGDVGYPLRFGSWNVRTRVLRSGEAQKTWNVHMLEWILLVVLPLAIVMQISVGFGPITSGRIFVFLIPVLYMAFFNAFSEELIFRGLLQPTLIRYVGPAFGIWLQGIFFGIHHWGSSPVPSFPMTVVIVFLGVIWGKSAYETRGLGWAVVAHMLVDFSFFSAHFVAVPETG